MNKKYLLAIDPGTTQSGYCLLDIDSHKIIEIGKIDNSLLADKLRADKLYVFDLTGKVKITYWFSKDSVQLVIEEIKSYGNAVGDTTLQTCVWVGRFIECWGGREIAFIPRKTVVTTLCLNPRARDSNIRQAMINKYGSPGTKKAPGVLYGVKRDMWQALGLAHAWIEIKDLLSYQEDQLFN